MTSEIRLTLSENDNIIKSLVLKTSPTWSDLIENLQKFQTEANDTLTNLLSKNEDISETLYDDDGDTSDDNSADVVEVETTPKKRKL